MPRSMTGYGVADGPVSGGLLQAEIRTVNHRHFNASVKLPAGLQPFEATLRQTLRERIERGHVSLGMRWLEEPLREVVISVNSERARSIVAALRELKATVDVPGEVDLAFLARQPEVLTVAAPADAPIDQSCLAGIVDRALAEVIAMREEEGTALARELGRLLGELAASLGRVVARAPERVERERDRLQASVQDLLGGQPVHDDRLHLEIALLADKLDITEEVARVRAHLDACEAALAGPGPIGRKLAFLGQEILREVNTIGSKAADAVIAHEVVAMKGTIEKFREQVENIE